MKTVTEPTLATLQADADRFRFVCEYYRPFDLRMSKKAEQKLRVTEEAILRVKQQYHTATYNPTVA